MKRIVIFASGSGSNAENLISFFHDSSEAGVVQVLTNNPRAKVIDRCNRLKVSCFCFNRTAFYDSEDVLELLRLKKPDLIVLAGFLWKVPTNIISEFPDKIINVHPALLPKYGGKGMYGMHVHRAVIESGDKESGISIHYVNEHYDEGALIFQASCEVTPNDSPESLVEKIHELEMRHFPEVVKSLLSLKNGE